MTASYYVSSIVYFNKADITLCLVKDKADLFTAWAIYAGEITEAIMVKYARKKSKLDNPNICFCSQTQCRNP